MNLEKIKSQSISIILNRGFIAIISLLLEIVFIKYLTVEEKGEIFYIRSNIELFAYIFSFGLGFSIIHFRSKYGDKYDGQIVKWILFSFITLILSSYVLYHIDIVIKYLFISKEYFLPAVVGSFFTLLSFFLQKIYLSDDNITLHNKVIFYSKVIVSLSLMAISIFVKSNLIYFLILTIPISLFLVNIYFIFKIKLNFKNKNKNKFFFNFSLNIYLYELLFQIKNKFDNFLVLYFLGISTLGIFSVAVSFGALVLIVSSSISLILLKEMSAIENIQFNEINKILKKYISLMLLITLLSIVFVYGIVNIFGYDKFEESINLYMLYSINLILFSIIVFFQSYFGSIKKTSLQFKSLLISFTPYSILFFIDLTSIHYLLLLMISSNILQCIYLFTHFYIIKNKI